VQSEERKTAGCNGLADDPFQRPKIQSRLCCNQRSLNRTDANTPRRGREEFVATDGAQIDTDQIGVGFSLLCLICVHLCPICGEFLFAFSSLRFCVSAVKNPGGKGSRTHHPALIRVLG
jgi:hypothetical protein